MPTVKIILPFIFSILIFMLCAWVKPTNLTSQILVFVIIYIILVSFAHIICEQQQQPSPYYYQMEPFLGSTSECDLRADKDCKKEPTCALGNGRFRNFCYPSGNAYRLKNIK